MKFKSIAFMLFIGTACSVNPKNYGVNPIRISLNQGDGSREMGELVESIRFVPLETSDSCMIGSYDRIIVGDDHIAVLDKMQKSVFLFTPDGRFRNKIEHVGNSGQEYIEISDVAVEDGHLIVFDGTKAQLQFYTLSGAYEKTLTVCPGDQFCIEKEGNYVIYSGVGEFRLHVYDRNGREMGTYFPIESRFQNLPSSFTNSKSIDLYDDRVLFTNYFECAVFELSDRKAEAKYVFDFGSENMPEDLLTYDSPQDFMQKIVEDKSVQAIESFTETDRWLTFQARNTPVYYDKRSGTPYVFSNLKVPYGILFGAAPMGITAVGDYYSTITASNIINMKPLIKKYGEEYPFLNDIAETPVHESDNDWLLLYKIRD